MQNIIALMRRKECESSRRQRIIMNYIKSWGLELCTNDVDSNHTKRVSLWASFVKQDLNRGDIFYECCMSSKVCHQAGGVGGESKHFWGNNIFLLFPLITLNLPLEDVPLLHRWINWCSTYWSREIIMCQIHVGLSKSGVNSLRSFNTRLKDEADSWFRWVLLLLIKLFRRKVQNLWWMWEQN